MTETQAAALFRELELAQKRTAEITAKATAAEAVIIAKFGRDKLGGENLKAEVIKTGERMQVRVTCGNAIYTMGVPGARALAAFIHEMLTPHEIPVPDPEGGRRIQLEEEV